MPEISLTVQPLQTRHTPRGCPAPGPSSAQFLFTTFATIFDQIIGWVIIDESTDYFQNNNYRVQTLEKKAPTLPKSVGALPVSSEGFLGAQTLLLNTTQQWHSTHSEQLQPPEDMKHCLLSDETTLSHAKLLSDCILKVCSVCKTCSS